MADACASGDIGLIGLAVMVSYLASTHISEI